VAAYRIYYGGGDPAHAWIVQALPELKTVAAVAKVHVEGPVEFPPAVDGPKPNGVALATGTLRIADNVAWIE
jgi:hypothetical protein